MQRANAGAAKGNCGNGEVTEKAGEIVARVWDPRPALCFGSPWGVLARKICVYSTLTTHR